MTERNRFLFSASSKRGLKARGSASERWPTPGGCGSAPRAPGGTFLGHVYAYAPPRRHPPSTRPSLSLSLSLSLLLHLLHTEYMKFERFRLLQILQFYKLIFKTFKNSILYTHLYLDRSKDEIWKKWLLGFL